MDSLQDTLPAIASGWVIYFHIGTLSVMIWDIMNNVKRDYELLVSDFCIKTFLYLVSRTMAFLYAFIKVIYLTIPMQVCSVLSPILSAFYVVGVYSILLLSSIHLVLLLEKQRPLVIALTVGATLVLGGSITLAIGVSGKNPQPLHSRVCQDSTQQYVATAFILLFVYHAIMLAIILLSASRSTSADVENHITTQERYNRPARGTSMLSLSRPLTSEHQVFYVLTTVLSLAATIWFLASSGSSGSFRLIPVVVYLVCASITLGRVLRSNKIAEKQRRINDALSPPIKLDMPRLDINDTYTSTRSLGPGPNEEATQCNVADLFAADMEVPPPIVEIEVNKIVQSTHDYSVSESDGQSDDGRWENRSKFSLGNRK